MRREIYRRTLRTSEQMAHTEHFCDDCCCPISSGDYYESTISAQKILISEGTKMRVKKTIYTLKRHINPPCDGFDPEWEKMCEELENEGGLESSMVA